MVVWAEEVSTSEETLSVHVSVAVIGALTTGLSMLRLGAVRVMVELGSRSMVKFVGLMVIEAIDAVEPVTSTSILFTLSTTVVSRVTSLYAASAKQGASNARIIPARESVRVIW